jgi:hypothetical protein
MVMRRCATFICFSMALVLSAGSVRAQRRRIPTGGRLAVVVDERLAALRAGPWLSARLIERLSRGRFLAITGAGHSPDGLTFFHVRATRRRSGWIQSEAIVMLARGADDVRLMDLIRSSEEFELIARARVFLQTFPHSSLRPAVLLLYCDTTEAMSEKLSREAARRFEREPVPAGGAPEYSYFLNFSALDRYNRQGVRFIFDREARRFHYDGWAWREIVRRYPQSAAAAEARKKLEGMAPNSSR